MRKLVIVCLALAFALSFGVLAQDDDVEDVEMPGADGVELMAYILETNPYEEWAAVYVDDTELLSGESPHGPVVAAFANDAVHEALEDADFDGALPYDSIIVKENYQAEGATVDDPGDLTAVTVMYKVEGFDPDDGDWFWLMFAPDAGEIGAEGAVGMCIGCHHQVGNADYTLFGFDE